MSEAVILPLRMPEPPKPFEDDDDPGSPVVVKGVHHPLES